MQDNTLRNQTPPPLSRQDALLALLHILQNHGYGFTAITPLSHARINARLAQHAQAPWAREYKKGAALESLRDIFGWSRPFRANRLDAELFMLMQAADILVLEEECWRSRLRVSSLDGRLYWHSAYPTVAEDAVFFGPDTYRYAQFIQRETNAYAQIYDTKSQSRAARVIDIGCGAGAGAITLALRYPHAQVLATDINAHALELTQLNAQFSEVNNVQALHSDLLNDVPGNFDLIAANPPYLIDVGNRAYRHGGETGAELSLAIVQAAITRLQPGGRLLLYTGVAIRDGADHFRQNVEIMLQAHPKLQWRYDELDPDVFGEELDQPVYADTDRIAIIGLVVTLSG